MSSAGYKEEVKTDFSSSSLFYLKIELYGLLITSFSVLLFLSLASFDMHDISSNALTRAKETANLIGPVGAHMADLFFIIFGVFSFVISVCFFVIGIFFMLNKRFPLSGRDIAATAGAFLSVESLLYIIFRDSLFYSHRVSGLVGYYTGQVLISLFSSVGSAIICYTIMIVSLLYLLKKPMGFYLRFAVKMLKPAAYPFRIFALFVSSLFMKLFRKIFQRSGLAPETKVVMTDEIEVIEPEPISGKRSPTKLEKFVPPDKIEPAFAENASDSAQDYSGLDIKTEVQENLPFMLEQEISQPESSEKKTKPRIVDTRPKIKPAFQGSLDLINRDEDTKNNYVLPPLSLLTYAPNREMAIDQTLLHSNAQLLENKLKDYRVEGQVVEIRPGPVVTLYEFVPAPGIKISQVSNLADDLAMALKAISIRIVAPIPGKGTIGIEVPNEVRETVFLKEILTHDRFVRSTSKLSLALGKDITGNPVVADLAKMPHLLIAGATGSGKSVALNGFLLSLLYKATPSEVRIILADPKVVELSVYEGIPHLLLPVVSDPKQIASAMKWAVNEMERRYELLGSAEVRNIVSYNEKIDEMQKSDLLKKEKSVFQDTAVTDRAESATVHDEISQKLPFIVIIIDEFADIMAVASKDVEGSVMRLAQKARAAGIHLIMATQRPSKEVITGLIKSNLNARISFKVASKIDSRIVLDTNGADNLLSAGDMLFLTPDSSLRRIHGPFVGEDEVKRVVEYWKSQGKPEYDYEIIQSDRENVEISEEEKDEFYDMAKKIVMETRKASISFIQRRLGVGYNRAAKMIEMMEFEGLISPQNSRGEREVLIT